MSSQLDTSAVRFAIEVVKTEHGDQRQVWFRMADAQEWQLVPARLQQSMLLILDPPPAPVAVQPTQAEAVPLPVLTPDSIIVASPGQRPAIFSPNEIENFMFDDPMARLAREIKYMSTQIGFVFRVEELPGQTADAKRTSLQMQVAGVDTSESDKLKEIIQGWLLSLRGDPAETPPEIK